MFQPEKASVRASSGLSKWGRHSCHTALSADVLLYDGAKGMYTGVAILRSIII
jgi:hypothetical protein